MTSPAQSVYIGHGAPLNILWQTEYRNNLEKFSKAYQQPSAILVVSAHFERNIPLQITSSPHPSIIYDYFGFPEEMYQLQYPAKGNPDLAKQVAQTLNGLSMETHLNSDQGLDHGAWIPLKIMYPDADIPILQLSIPIPRKPEDLYRIGQSLRKFKDQGVMLMGSGNLVHNLPHAFLQLQKGNFTIDTWAKAPVEPWANEVDIWLKDNIDSMNASELLHASQNLHNFKVAAPTTEHFDPLYFILGTLDDRESMGYIHEGFEAGSISMRSMYSEA